MPLAVHTLLDALFEERPCLERHYSFFVANGARLLLEKPVLTEQPGVISPGAKASMMDMRAIARLLLARPLIATIGRKNVYRLSRLLIGEARRDQTYDIASNGEQLVQATVLQWSFHPTIFDVGANVGDWTASLLQLASHAGTELTIHAFEPCLSTFQQLRERIEREQWTNVIPVPVGCSSAPGTACVLVKFDGCSGNSIVGSDDEISFAMENAAEPAETLQSARTETVEMTSVDAYCAEHSIEHIDLLKCDAEGHDFEVILGTEGMLRRKAIGVFQFEYNMRWIGSRRYLRDVFKLVRPLAYAVGKITPEGIEFYPEWQREMETYQGGNFIACVQEWLPRFTCLTPSWLIDP